MLCQIGANRLLIRDTRMNNLLEALEFQVRWPHNQVPILAHLGSQHIALIPMTHVHFFSLAFI